MHQMLAKAPTRLAFQTPARSLARPRCGPRGPAPRRPRQPRHRAAHARRERRVKVHRVRLLHRRVLGAERGRVRGADETRRLPPTPRWRRRRGGGGRASAAPRRGAPRGARARRCGVRCEQVVDYNGRADGDHDALTRARQPAQADVVRAVRLHLRPTHSFLHSFLWHDYIGSHHVGCGATEACTRRGAHKRARTHMHRQARAAGGGARAATRRAQPNNETNYQTNVSHKQTNKQTHKHTNNPCTCGRCQTRDTSRRKCI